MRQNRRRSKEEKAFEAQSAGKDTIGPMSPATALEELETRAHLTMAETSRARIIFRQPRNPKSIAQAWRLVATVQAMIAFAESPTLEDISSSDTFPVVVQLLQLSYDKARAFALKATEAGMGPQDWHRALRDAIETLADVLEGFYLARDPEFREVVAHAIRELAPAGDTVVDWRAALAAMPD